MLSKTALKTLKSPEYDTLEQFCKLLQVQKCLNLRYMYWLFRFRIFCNSRRKGGPLEAG